MWFYHVRHKTRYNKVSVVLSPERLSFVEVAPEIAAHSRKRSSEADSDSFKVSGEEAEALVHAGCKIVAEGSNMGCSREAISVFEKSREVGKPADAVWFAPGVFEAIPQPQYEI